MGGVSESSLTLTADHKGLFSGHVSLENFGGFASVMLRTSIDVNPNQKFIVLKVKGDGKAYQFRLKASNRQSHSYITTFQTTGKWQTIKLALSTFKPSFRGRELDMSNFNFDKIEEVRFLIANKKEEDFSLLIDHVSIK
jgi:hypothetical protein